MLDVLVHTWRKGCAGCGPVLVAIGWCVVRKCLEQGCACAKCRGLQAVRRALMRYEALPVVAVVNACWAQEGAVPEQCEVLAWRGMKLVIHVRDEEMYGLARAACATVRPMRLLPEARDDTAQRAAYEGQGMVNCRGPAACGTVAAGCGRAWSQEHVVDSALPSPTEDNTNVFEDGMLQLREHTVLAVQRNWCTLYFQCGVEREKVVLPLHMSPDHEGDEGRLVTKCKYTPGDCNSKFKVRMLLEGGKKLAIVRKVSVFASSSEYRCHLPDRNNAHSSHEHPVRLSSPRRPGGTGVGSGPL